MGKFRVAFRRVSCRDQEILGFSLYSPDILRSLFSIFPPISSNIFLFFLRMEREDEVSLDLQP